jgi:hypothetical protein
MQRRAFIKNTTFCAVAVSAYGFIRFDGNHFVGDCETTTDILGPFYRPNSPLRNNLIVNGQPGNLIELSGIIRHKDCITPYNKAKIELWHCDGNGVYDNTSAESAIVELPIQMKMDITHLKLFYQYHMMQVVDI